MFSIALVAVLVAAFALTAGAAGWVVWRLWSDVEPRLGSRD